MFSFKFCLCYLQTRAWNFDKKKTECNSEIDIVVEKGERRGGGAIEG